MNEIVTPAFCIENLNVYYDDFHAVKNVNVSIERNKITSLIGPSGCGKSTFLRCLNRMNDIITNCTMTGKIFYNGDLDILQPSCNVVELRTRVGMIFQKPNPFPKTIYDNVAYGPRIHNMVTTKAETDQCVEKALRDASLWDEVKDKLKTAGTQLSGGQQQRLCIARSIACNPEIILMDEPCSALDPIATGRIEELMFRLREDYTIIIVTHSMQQAARTSQYTAFFHLGEIFEFDETATLFRNPKHAKTEAYISGRYG